MNLWRQRQNHLLDYTDLRGCVGFFLLREVIAGFLFDQTINREQQ
ncbi:hypothetical protein [Limnobaculum xujianqingii]|nr:hypothetical protein [Limnobaculum xujianqingii]